MDIDNVVNCPSSSCNAKLNRTMPKKFMDHLKSKRKHSSGKEIIDEFKCDICGDVLENKEITVIGNHIISHKRKDKGKLLIYLILINTSFSCCHYYYF